MAEGATGPLLADLLTRCTFPPPGTALACAVSGGPDSLALLLLAVEAGCLVTAYHVDHGLRPGSAAEAEVVAKLAADLGAGFEARSVAVAQGPNLEARARAARFGVLPAGVATGHTMDDQAETVLLNVLRGAAADGLAGMAPGLRHPLLALRRAETHALCRVAGLEPVRDPSNEDAAFTRNRVRHELLPLCADVAGRDPVPLLARQAALLRDDVALLEALAAAPCPTRPTPGPWLPPTRSWPGAPCGPGCVPPGAAGTRPRWPRSSASWPWPGARRAGPSWPAATGCAGRRDACASSGPTSGAPVLVSRR